MWSPSCDRDVWIRLELEQIWHWLCMGRLVFEIEQRKGLLMQSQSHTVGVAHAEVGEVETIHNTNGDG